MHVDPQAPEIAAGDFVAMMRATKLCVLIHDADTKNILWANPAACEMLGWSVTELRPLKANHMSSSAQQYDRVIGRAWLQEAVDKGASRIEWHYRSRNGRVIPTDAVAVRVELERGTAVMVQFRDIEREQQIERELRLTTSYIDALARHTSTIALMLDSAGTLRFATDTAVARIGAAPNEPLGPLAEYGRLWLEGSPVTWDGALARANPSTAIQLEIPQDDGTSVWLEGSLESVQDAGDHALLMILHDVSDRIQGEVRRERELHRENYLARYNAMGDMAMAIAHELGQPLAAAGNFLAGVRARGQSLAEKGEIPAAAASQLSFGVERAAGQIERASTIVDAVREFVGHLEQVDQVVDLGDVLDQCLHFVRLRAVPAGVTVTVHRHPEPVMVRCERVLTGQVLLNFCVNAIDEMASCEQQRRQLTITTRLDDGFGVLTVDDRGRGLAHDPFEESFTSKAHGSGIGLALSYRVITRQHGRIWAEPRDEGGSRFGFALPLATDDAA
ncbi:PAS domain-containing sensor histidine kinase [Prauserella alba]|uniref:histidine kinase n=1 Tax=Prauserella alba TaxID=176898 RepID=A0ABP4GA50_9PSEU|nr:ATP-binding protein [Prauserella alba]MCP2182844.1 PAS domain S-box-containing protein [Prauserella alba]